MTSKPIAVLQGHSTGVIGVKIHEGLMQVFSYSKDAVSCIIKGIKPYMITAVCLIGLCAHQRRWN